MTTPEQSPDDTQRITLLVVDDDDAFRDALADAFVRRGYAVRRAATCGEAIGVGAAFNPERAIVDLRLPDGSGLDVLDALRRVDPHTAVVLLSGQVNESTGREARRRGAVACMAKPAEPAEIETAFARADESARPVDLHTHAVLRALEECNGDVVAVAQRLGVHRRVLLRRLAAAP